MNLKIINRAVLDFYAAKPIENLWICLWS